MLRICTRLVPALLIMFLCSCNTQTRDADGSRSKAIAVVLGKKITVKDKNELDGMIFGPLLKRFAKDNKIEPTEEELAAFILNTAEIQRQLQNENEEDRKKLVAELKDSNLTERERKKKEAELERLERILKDNREMEEQTKGMEKELRESNRRMAQHFVEAWRINQALYAKYGGRVIFQQAGPEPLDAYRDFLKEEERKGSFRILDRQYEASFWRYFTNEGMHTFYEKDEGAEFINTPWWREKPADK